MRFLLLSILTPVSLAIPHPWGGPWWRSSSSSTSSVVSPVLPPYWQTQQPHAIQQSRESLQSPATHFQPTPSPTAPIVSQGPGPTQATVVRNEDAAGQPTAIQTPITVPRSSNKGAPTVPGLLVTGGLPVSSAELLQAAYSPPTATQVGSLQTVATNFRPTSPVTNNPGVASSVIGSSVVGNVQPSTVQSGAGTKYTGDITYWYPGLGSCGSTNGNADHVCALSLDMMDNGPNPNTNPKCYKYITLTNPAHPGSWPAEIVDSCKNCSYSDVDLSPAVFAAVAPDGNGRVSGIVWSFD